MLENSKDLLYIVLSFCVLWLTIFICWLVYYLISILRNANDIVEDIRARFRGIEEAMRSIRDRLEHATSSLGFVSEGIVRLIQYFVSQKKSKTAPEKPESEEKKKKH